MPWHATVALSALAEGTPRSLLAAGRPVLLVRRGDAVLACDAVCPHKYGPLEDGEVHGGQITCPVHAGTFDLATGAPAPGCEWAGRLAVYATRVVEGRVEVEI